MKASRRRNAIHLFLGLLTTVAILAVFACLGNYLLIPLLTRRPAEVVVPAITGMSHKEAEQLLQRAGLTVGTVRQVNNPNAPTGQVVAQYPRAGRRTKRGRLVDIEISTGAARVTVPSVEGLPTASALFALEQNGLTVVRIESLRTPRLPPDQVISIRPAAGCEVAPGTEVVISISTRVGVFQMPNIVGMDSETAQGIIASRGLILGEIRTALSTEPVGRVLVQYPEEGMPVVEGDTVTLIVSGHKQ